MSILVNVSPFLTAFHFNRTLTAVLTTKFLFLPPTISFAGLIFCIIIAFETVFLQGADSLKHKAFPKLQCLTSSHTFHECTQVSTVPLDILLYQRAACVYRNLTLDPCHPCHGKVRILLLLG